MATNQARLLTIQSDGRIMLDASSRKSAEVEDSLRQIAQLSSAAGSIHTYRIPETAMWSAASNGWSGEALLGFLRSHSSSPVPRDLETRISDFFGRYGRLRLQGEPGGLWLTSDDPLLLREVGSLLGQTPKHGWIPVSDSERGRTKAFLAEAGYPVRDCVKPIEPQTADYDLLPNVILRDYQKNAVDRFLKQDQDGGVILLPCGAGKTLVGVAAAARLRAWVLVVTPNRTIGEQWADHFARLTSLCESDVSLFDEVTGARPVTIVTYQALTSVRDGLYARLAEAGDVPWGLVIYDEVHTLPADVFRQSAALQSRRRLGLTATLVREDGREKEVYALVGPPVWQSRWRDLERLGWISPVECIEVRVRSAHDELTEERGLAAKIRTIRRLLERHREDQVLIAAHRVKEVRAISRALNSPAVTGETAHAERQRLYQAFRSREIGTLVVSRVANVGVDLPDANVLIQASGAFGSRLEEAQRLGRLLRPGDKNKPARFYSLVLPVTREREYAERRQRFLVDQGYRYRVVNARA